MMDIRAAKELQNSSLWKQVENEIDYRTKSLMEGLLTCDPSELLSIRTRITALNELKNMPETVIEREST